MTNVSFDSSYIRASNEIEFYKLSILIYHLLHCKVRISLNIFRYVLRVDSKFRLFRSKTYPLWMDSDGMGFKSNVVTSVFRICDTPPNIEAPKDFLSFR